MNASDSHRGSLRAAAATGLVAMLLALGQLFVPTTIGTADTGDGLRLLCQIQAGDPHFWEAHSSAERFVAITYRPIPPNPVACGSFRVTERYPSSALAVLAGAQQLTHLIGSHAALDMRVTGVLYSLLFGIAIGLFVVVLPGPLWARVATAAAIGLLGADATFVPYFISPFSEPMEYVALLGTYVGLLALWRRREVPRWLLGVVTLTFAVLVTAKAQDALLMVPLALALLTVRSPGGRWAAHLGARVLPAVAAIGLLAAGSANLYLQPRLYHEELVYTDVFYTILRDSPDVGADLRELRLPAELSRYAGKTYFEVRRQTAHDPAYRVFVRTISFSDIARFYVHHPDRLSKLTGAAVEDVVKARHALPNTTRTETATPQVVCRICLIPPVGSALVPVALTAWPLWELLVLTVGGLLVWRRWRDLEWRALGLLLLTIVATTQFYLATAIFGDGYAELGKHVFPAVVGTWLAIPLVALGVAGVVPALRGRKPSAA